MSWIRESSACCFSTPEEEGREGNGFVEWNFKSLVIRKGNKFGPELGIICFGKLRDVQYVG